MCVDVLPAVCGKSRRPDPSSGPTCRSTPVSLWHHRGWFDLMRQPPWSQPISQPYKSSPAGSLSSVWTDTQARWVRTLLSLVPPEPSHVKTKPLCALGFFQIQQCLRLSSLRLFSWPVLWLRVLDRVSITTGVSVFGGRGLDWFLLFLIDGEPWDTLRVYNASHRIFQKSI